MTVAKEPIEGFPEAKALPELLKEGHHVCVVRVGCGKITEAPLLMSRWWSGRGEAGALNGTCSALKGRPALFVTIGKPSANHDQARHWSCWSLLEGLASSDERIRLRRQ